MKSAGEKKAGEMSFLSHLEALRWHLVRSVSVILVLAVVLFLNKELLFDKILLAAHQPDFLTYRALCKLGTWLNLQDELCVHEITFALVSTELSAQFSAHMWAALLGGFVVGFPYLVYELWRFVKPALHHREQRYARGLVFYTSLLFLTGVLFGYYIISPMTVNFLGSYQVSEQVKSMITLSSFVSTVTTMTLITGLLFELPIVVYFLTRIGMLSPVFMRKYRRHAVVLILIIAAIITPTSDATTLLLVALPLWLLYEVSIFVSAWVARSKQKSNPETN